MKSERYFNAIEVRVECDGDIARGLNLGAREIASRCCDKLKLHAQTDLKIIRTIVLDIASVSITACKSKFILSSLEFLL